MATKKFSPAQIAAQKLFAERARAGTLGKGTKRNPEPSHDFARIGKPFAFDGRTWKVSQYSHNGKTIEAYTTDRKKFIRREFDVSELMMTRRKTNPDKSKPRAYVMRASQATGRPPVKGTKAGNRLITRRKKALSAPAGYFPNPMNDRETDQLSMMLSGIMMAQAYNENARSKKLTTLMLDWVKSPLRRDEIYKKSLEAAGSTGTSYSENPTKKNLTTGMMKAYQVICMHPKKHVVGIFKTMAEAKMVATAMANAKGVAYAVKTVKVHKAHFAA